MLKIFSGMENDQQVEFREVGWDEEFVGEALAVFFKGSFYRLLPLDTNLELQECADYLRGLLGVNEDDKEYVQVQWYGLIDHRVNNDIAEPRPFSRQAAWAWVAADAS